MKYPKTIISFLLSFIILTACNDTGTAKTGTPADNQPATKKEESPVISDPGLKFGKYGCTASHYNNGLTEYQPRGFITIDQSGNYSYAGFKKPSTGTYTVDKKGNLHFKGGYIDGGEATKIDRPNKFFLVFPNNPDNRWTIGWVED